MSPELSSVDKASKKLVATEASLAGSKKLISGRSSVAMVLPNLETCRRSVRQMLRQLVRKESVKIKKQETAAA